LSVGHVTYLSCQRLRIRISKQAHEWQEEGVQGDQGDHGEVQLQVI